MSPATEMQVSSTTELTCVYVLMYIHLDVQL